MRKTEEEGPIFKFCSNSWYSKDIYIILYGSFIAFIFFQGLSSNQIEQTSNIFSFYKISLKCKQELISSKFYILKRNSRPELSSVKPSVGRSIKEVKNPTFLVSGKHYAIEIHLPVFTVIPLCISYRLRRSVKRKIALSYRPYLWSNNIVISLSECGIEIQRNFSGFETTKSYIGC